MSFGRRTEPVKKRYFECLYQPLNGWEEEMLEDDGLLITQPGTYNYVFMEFLQGNSGGRTLEEAVADLVSNHQQAKDNVLVYNSGVARTSRGLEHGYFSYSFSDGEGERLREVNIVIPFPGRTGNTLFVTLASPESDYAILESTFQKFVDEIEVA